MQRLRVYHRKEAFNQPEYGALSFNSSPHEYDDSRSMKTENEREDYFSLSEKILANLYTKIYDNFNFGHSDHSDLE